MTGAGISLYSPSKVPLHLLERSTISCKYDQQGDAVVTDVAGVEAAVERCGADNVLCVVTTTSCFAPRIPDKVREPTRRETRRLRC